MDHQHRIHNMRLMPSRRIHIHNRSLTFRRRNRLLIRLMCPSIPMVLRHRTPRIHLLRLSILHIQHKRILIRKHNSRYIITRARVLHLFRQQIPCMPGRRDFP